MRTGDLVSRLAWGVGNRNAAWRRVRGCSCQLGAFNWKLLVIYKIMGSFSSFVIKYFITKLEKKQPDTYVSPPGWLQPGAS